MMVIQLMYIGQNKLFVVHHYAVRCTALHYSNSTTQLLLEAWGHFIKYTTLLVCSTTFPLTSVSSLLGIHHTCVGLSMMSLHCCCSLVDLTSVSCTLRGGDCGVTWVQWRKLWQGQSALGCVKETHIHTHRGCVPIQSLHPSNCASSVFEGGLRRMHPHPAS